MEISDTSKDKGFVLNWNIENFNFCWHRTGECLESPLFNINIPCETSWKLLLYPRGEDDGEYISCYLFRADGGPEMVDVDFELCLYIEDVEVMHSISFSKIYSFKCCQREGLNCFAPRWQVFAATVAQKEKFTLTVRCKILNVNENTLSCADQFICTVIETYSVSDTEQFDCDSCLGSDVSRDIEIKPILEDEALLNLNLSYCQKYLVIKINPKNCKKIKYAVCKISVINHSLNESPIQHVRSWNGKIKAGIWKCYVPQAESVTPDGKYPTQNSFLLHYDLTFSTGNSVRDTKNLKYSVQECLNLSLKETSSACTALKALEDLYRSRSFADMEILTKAGIIKLHKALLCTRATELIDLIPKDGSYYQFRIENDNMAHKFVFFIYSDILEVETMNAAHFIYKLSVKYGVEPLKEKYSTYFKNRLSIYNAIAILFLSHHNYDQGLVNFVTNYIINNADNLLGTVEWRQLLELKQNLGKKIMLLYYRKLNKFHKGFINTRLQVNWHNHFKLF